MDLLHDDDGERHVVCRVLSRGSGSETPCSFRPRTAELIELELGRAACLLSDMLHVQYVCIDDVASLSFLAQLLKESLPRSSPQLPTGQLAGHLRALLPRGGRINSLY
ncbi:hypothetical protein MHYP_G00061540 [Metynnis hypsauchen]